jgi:ATP-dependent helicase/nuclease subunit A
LQRVSPSSLEGGSVLRLEKGFGPENELSKLRGTVLHAWFQKIEWLEDGLTGDDDLLAIANEVVGSRPASKHISDWLKDFHQILDREPIRNHLSKTAYKDRAGCQPIVQNERAFAVSDDSGLLAGSIDRLVLLSEKDRIVAAEIIDFKTDQLVESNKKAWQARVEFYRPQLEAYRRAVGSMLNLPATKISARLLFVASGRLVDM